MYRPSSKALVANHVTAVDGMAVDPRLEVHPDSRGVPDIVMEGNGQAPIIYRIFGPYAAMGGYR
jgi:hypothetical protein